MADIKKGKGILKWILIVFIPIAVVNSCNDRLDALTDKVIAAAPPEVLDGAPIIGHWVKLPTTAGFDIDNGMETFEGEIIDFDGDEFDFDVHSKSDYGRDIVAYHRGNRKGTGEVWEGTWTIHGRNVDKCGTGGGHWEMRRLGSVPEFLGWYSEYVRADDCRILGQEYYSFEFEVPKMLFD